jgi:hypothetical protein
MKKKKKTRTKKIKSNQSAARQMLKAGKALDALDAAYHDRYQKYTSFVESIRNLATLERSEAWLSYVSSEIEDFGDQEALIYLTSRGIDCGRQIAALITLWKREEGSSLSSYIRGPVVWDPQKRRHQKTQASHIPGASEIEKLSPFHLRNFWSGGRQQELSIDATMLRTVSWCGIGGFDPWWKRLAKETASLFSYGGIERPAVGFWIFSMCRSEYAISLMPKTLKRALDDFELADYRQVSPWAFDYKADLPAVDHIPAAASIAFSNLILRPDEMDKELVSNAIGALQKHQNEDGSWPIWAARGEEPSIEATAMAVHAIAVSKPNGYERVLSFAKAYLEGHQNWRGHWDDKDACDITYLTVLVLDALQLADGGTALTFPLPSSSGGRPVNAVGLKGATTGQRRFSVALSFPGEIRPFVKAVADKISKRIGKEKIFYDGYYEAELARLDLDTYLQSVYHDGSDLVVVFSCSEYEKKQWCGLEWRAVRDIIKQRRGQDVMIIRMDDTKLQGIYSIDGYIDAGKRSPGEIADLILARLNIQRSVAK